LAERWSRLNGIEGHAGIAEIKELADDCVHCGFCLPACPTYLLWGREADSPRGRIYLIKAELEGRVSMTETFRRHFDTCLGCMSCVTACPSGVQYDRLIEATRPHIERGTTRAAGDRLFRGLLFALFSRPDRLRRLSVLLRVYQRSGLQRVVRASGALGLLPKRLAALERLTPVASCQRDLPAVVPVTPAGGPVRRRVGLLLGCVQRVFFSEVNEATARVLAAEGCEVHVPPAQGCCGALMLHAGREEEAAGAARRLIDVFEASGVEQIVINAAGCGSAMKTYGELLRHDPSYADRARAFAAKCVDVSELLAELEPRSPRHPLSLRVAYHDACHLQHAQRVRRQPRQILRSIPDLELCEIAEGDICCGSAGVYNLLEPDAAGSLRDRKVKHVLDTNADVIVSANPGCLLQISSGLEGAGRPMRTMHLVQLLDASIRGTDPGGSLLTVRPGRGPG
jgi:glycolate oxidase iron-sulfur subunit